MGENSSVEWVKIYPLHGFIKFWMHGAFFLIFFLKSFQIFFEVKGLLY